MNPRDPLSEYWTTSPVYPEVIEQINNYKTLIIGNENEIEGDTGVFIMTSSEFFNAFQSY